MHQSKANNSLFHQVHANMARLHLSNIGHVILYLHGDLLLLKRTSNGNYVPLAKIQTAAMNRDYIRIKNLVHISVTLTMLIDIIILGKRSVSASIDDLNAVLVELQDMPGKTEMSQSERDVIDLSTALILSLHPDMPSQEVAEQLRTYLHKIAKVNEHLCQEATTLQLTSIDSIIKKWIAVYKISMQTSRTVIVGPDGAREGLIEMQYFEALYRAIHKEPMTQYVTMLPKQMGGINIEDLIDELGKRELNKAIGKSMLDDKNAMTKDVLARYAPSLLSTFFGKKTGACPIKSLKNNTQDLICSLFKIG
jgi:hypothetical protein